MLKSGSTYLLDPGLPWCLHCVIISNIASRSRDLWQQTNSEVSLAVLLSESGSIEVACFAVRIVATIPEIRASFWFFP